MHPLLGRFLSPDAAREALRAAEAGEPLDEGATTFTTVARSHPEKVAALGGAGGARRAGSDAQAALVYLAAHAAARALDAHPKLGPAAAKARAALAEEGAGPEETEAFLASILLEEAFGYESDPEAFDAAYVEETLGEVPALAALTRESVDALMLSFAQAAPDEAERARRSRIARALFDVAWEDGPAPVNPEHVEMLIDRELQAEDEDEAEANARAAVALLHHLAKQGLIGPTRLVHLRAQLGEEDA